MADNSLDRPQSYVVHFIRTLAGELRCRVTDVLTRESWIVEEGDELRMRLVAKSTAPKR